MVFIADALGGWLVGHLADAGRKKLTELVLGSEQQRALRRAADAAVLATAQEISPPGGEQAGQVAMVISEVFRDPAPDAPPAGPVTLLEGLQAGIAGQLAVLDDAGLTGIGQSSADVLGVPGTALADRLISIFTRGPDGRRPCFGGTELLQTDPAWKDNLVFSEYFHGENAAGLGASHQTGWTGLVADIIIRRHGEGPAMGNVIHRGLGMQTQR